MTKALYIGNAINEYEFGYIQKYAPVAEALDIM